MSDNLAWKKLANLRPSLPRHIEFKRRVYNNERWYLLQDKSNGRFHRLSVAAYQLICLMDGRKSLGDIFIILSASKLPDSDGELLTRGELVHLFQYLYVSDLLICDMPPNTQELFQRRQQKSKQRWLQLLINPLTWKISLGNPDKLLTLLLPLAKLLATRGIGIVWLLVVAYALLQAGNHWSQLTHGQLNRILAPNNLFLLWLTYPLLKILHELGHGLFTKVWGGNVHECGIVFVLGTPLPYVDASAATAFPTKTQRLMVSAAGIAVELFLAALALLFWLQLNPGILRDILYNIIIIGSISTLFFNGNPLMRFDGYHLLSDVLNIPNLATRASQQLSYLIRRYAYGIPGLYSGATSFKEAWLFTTYGIAAFLYRLLILSIIIGLVTSYFPQLGLIVGLWLVSFQILWPVAKYVIFLIKGKQLQHNRKRAIIVATSGALVVLLGLVAIPMPMSTSAEGVIWLPDAAHVKANSTGEIIELLVEDGAMVTKDQPLFKLLNLPLSTELAFKQAQFREYDARYQEVWSENQVQAQSLAQEMEAIKAEINYLQERVDNLFVRSPGSGVFELTQTHALQGSYIEQGESLGIINNASSTRIRTVLTQKEIGLVRASLMRVEVELASKPATRLRGFVSQEVPAATYELPSAILGAEGGGRLAIDASQPKGTRVTEQVFLLDVNVQELQNHKLYGGRAYIKFVHPSAPLAEQFYRGLQQVFIRSFL